MRAAARVLCLLSFSACLCFSSYAGEGKESASSSPKATPVKVPVFNSQEVPSSARSREAVARVAPSLVRQLQSRDLSYGSPVFIRIFKSERELEVWVKDDDGYELFNTYAVAAMSGQLGPKLREGEDRKSTRLNSSHW